MKVRTQLLTDAKGAKLAAVIPLDEYQELLEDLQELAILAERREQPRLSLEQVKKRLRRDWGTRQGMYAG